MKCVALVRCQARDDEGKIRTFSRGQVFEFAKCPTNFIPLEGENAKPIDFSTAGEEELMEGVYDESDLKAFIKKEFDKPVYTSDRSKLVKILLDCRYRAIDQKRLESTVE